jgi:hypothetical protein
MVDAVAATKTLITAYNNKDFDKLERLVAPNLAFAHFNRGIAFSSRDAVFALLRQSAFAAVPDRAFEDPERITSSGNVAVVEHWWTGTPSNEFKNMPGHAEPEGHTRGQKLRVKLCSVFRFDDNGVLVEWKDHG